MLANYHLIRESTTPEAGGYAEEEGPDAWLTSPSAPRGLAPTNLVAGDDVDAEEEERPDAEAVIGGCGRLLAHQGSAALDLDETCRCGVDVTRVGVVIARG